jgi:hypothetical protein
MISDEKCKQNLCTSSEILQINLEKVKEKLSKISLMHNNPCDHIDIYKMELKNNVQLATEQAILEIEEMREKFLSKIDEYTSECLQASKSKKDLSNSDDILRELETFHSKHNLKQAEFDENLIQNANEYATELIKKVDYHIYDLETGVFNGPKKEFRSNEIIKKMGAQLLGSFDIFSCLNSEILSQVETINLVKLCEFSLSDQWELTYRSIGQFSELSVDEFHLKCDQNPNSLVIIQTKKGNVFGGYTEQNWSGEQHKYDQNAFIFSLINPSNKPVKCKQKKDNLSNSIYADKEYGPTFGRSIYHDIHIIKYDSDSTANFSCLGHAYENPENPFHSGRDSFLDGYYIFEIAKMEVFKRLF